MEKNYNLSGYVFLFQVERAGQSPLREVKVAFDIPVAIINNQHEFATFMVCSEIMSVQTISIYLHLHST
jgi:hypothetical protein